jgi:hypothetical protein
MCWWFNKEIYLISGLGVIFDFSLDSLSTDDIDFLGGIGGGSVFGGKKSLIYVIDFILMGTITFVLFEFLQHNNI